MGKFLKRGSEWRIVQDANLVLHDNLPPGNFVMKVDPVGNLYVEQVDDFVLPKKIYGDISHYADRIMTTFATRTDRSTGILLAGEKGGGKTLLAKTLCVRAAAVQIPTILINIPIAGDKMSQFIQEMKYPAVILMDEFEKVFSDKKDQMGMLTLLDGTFPTRKMFVLTCNDRWGIDQHMHNRPGRLFYSLEFSGMTIEGIEEYCKDHLKDQQYVTKVSNLLNIFSVFNFDMLQALVEEMNRYQEDPIQALKMLNIKPEEESFTQFRVRVFIKDQEIAEKDINDPIVSGSPLKIDGDNEELDSIYLFQTQRRDEDDDDDRPVAERPKPRRIDLKRSDLVKMDPKTGAFIFKQKDVVVIFTRIKSSKFSYSKYIY